MWTGCGRSFGYVPAPDLSAGKHKVRVRADVLSDPPRTVDSEEVEVTLTCPTDASPDGGVLPMAANQSDEQTGCSLRAGRRVGGQPMTLLIALALFLVRLKSRAARRAESQRSGPAH